MSAQNVQLVVKVYCKHVITLLITVL